MRKKIKIIVVGILFLSSVFTLITPNKVEATDMSSNFIDSIKVTKYDGSKGTFEPYESVKVNADWSIPNGSAKEGDSMTITLPATMYIPQGSGFDLCDQKGNIVARVTVDKVAKKATAIFNNYVETHSNISGRLWF